MKTFQNHNCIPAPQRVGTKNKLVSEANAQDAMFKAMALWPPISLSPHPLLVNALKQHSGSKYLVIPSQYCGTVAYSDKTMGFCVCHTIFTLPNMTTCVSGYQENQFSIRAWQFSLQGHRPIVRTWIS